MGGQDQKRPREGWRRYLRRPAPASLVSVGLHVAIGVLVWNAVQMPAVFDRFLQNDERAKPTAERPAACASLLSVTLPSGDVERLHAGNLRERREWLDTGVSSIG